MPEPVRRAPLLRACLEVLRDAEGPLGPGEVYDLVEDRFPLTDYEVELLRDGMPRWRVHMGYYTGDAATVGWITKIGGWRLTEAGGAALESYPGDSLMAELTKRLTEIRRLRERAVARLRGDERLIADIVAVVDPGSWTSYDDVAEIAGVEPDSVAHFIAAASPPPHGGYRVLPLSGLLPGPDLTNAYYRGSDLAARLAAEGLGLDANGLIDPALRLTAADLLERMSIASDELATEAPTRRAWLVRGSSVNGRDLVPVWLQRKTASLAADTLRPITPPVTLQELRTAVDEDYEHRSYSVRATRLAEFDAFCNKMHAGDYVLTTSQGKAYVGRVTGDAAYVKSSDDRSNLRRPVEWLNATAPVPFARLPHPLPARLHSQADVVDLTDNIGSIEALLTELGVTDRVVESQVTRELAFGEVTAEFAEQLFVDAAWLHDLVDVLWERRQVILYGPPGTGKTFLARQLASQLTEPNAVKLVQFHPSYTYEDFFEGFRPVERESGQVAFKLTPGPFRRLVESARENPTQPHILIIDEINRANLAKVFGELYFLLEYRDDPIALLYSPESDFTMPPNVFVVGTMNTTDRSIALVDAAMRRRFGFVELHPDTAPTSGLLRAWLKQHQTDEPSAVHNLDAPDLLDALNTRIEDHDLAIGPSYLMRPSVYANERGLERVWETSIMPLLEELHYGASGEALEGYRLPTLRRAVAAQMRAVDHAEQP